MIDQDRPVHKKDTHQAETDRGRGPTQSYMSGEKTQSTDTQSEGIDIRVFVVGEWVQVWFAGKWRDGEVTECREWPCRSWVVRVKYWGPGVGMFKYTNIWSARKQIRGRHGNGGWNGSGL